MTTRYILIRFTVMLMLLAGVFGLQPPQRTQAGPLRPLLTDSRPLKGLLNPNGSVNLATGYRGSLDPAGWRMSYAPDGAPVFMPSMPLAASKTWNPIGIGLSADWVATIAVDGSNVYVGGSFTDAGGNADADYIARWDGSTWNALGSGLNDAVYSIVVDGTNIYAGGYFTDADGNADADGIARWDGSNWNALGSGLNDTVFTIAVAGTDVYVGGLFTDAGENANADHIARWDSVSWNALGSGLAGGLLGGPTLVNTIAIEGLNVYVGGNFTDAGGNANADEIARWDGSNWNALGSGLNHYVDALAVDGTNIYVGGNFTDAGGNANADGIARWDGSAWNALGSGLGFGAVYAIAVDGTNIFVGGTFTEAGGNDNARYIARWDGSNWNALENGLTNVVNAIAVGGPDVYVGGFFTDVGGNVYTDYIARWGPGSPTIYLPSVMR
jgi:trimeric autotransporter adhesin